MNKTYIANENHPELKVGTKILWLPSTQSWFTELGINIALSNPIREPDWYDEVKEEKSIGESFEELFDHLKDLNDKHLKQQRELVREFMYGRKLKGE